MITVSKKIRHETMNINWLIDSYFVSTATYIMLFKSFYLISCNSLDNVTVILDRLTKHLICLDIAFVEYLFNQAGLFSSSEVKFLSL